jgi:soluble lytic murein transglycosylase-like protein
LIEGVLDGPRLPSTDSISRRFDALFERYGRGLPVAYLRSLAKRESNLNPADQSGPAWGLLQVIEVVRLDYNKRHGTDHTRLDLLKPETNIAVASDLLRRIIASYQRNHPRVPNMQTRWSNRRFVELLTFGWNAGYSERGGVGRVARYLEERGQAFRIDIDTIHQSARAAGASRHLSNARKVAWCKSVASLYERERQRDERRV